MLTHVVFLLMTWNQVKSLESLELKKVLVIAQNSLKKVRFVNAASRIERDENRDVWAKPAVVDLSSSGEDVAVRAPD